MARKSTHIPGSKRPLRRRNSRTKPVSISLGWENITGSILFFNGKALAVSLPNTVDLKVTSCDPGVRGDTVSGAQKPATLETGYVVNVPLFINEGDELRIDTRTGAFLKRVS